MEGGIPYERDKDLCQKIKPFKGKQFGITHHFLAH